MAEEKLIIDPVSKRRIRIQSDQGLSDSTVSSLLEFARSYLQTDRKGLSPDTSVPLTVGDPGNQQRIWIGDTVQTTPAGDEAMPTGSSVPRSPMPKLSDMRIGLQDPPAPKPSVATAPSISQYSLPATPAPTTPTRPASDPSYPTISSAPKYRNPLADLGSGIYEQAQNTLKAIQADEVKPATGLKDFVTRVVPESGYNAVRGMVTSPVAVPAQIAVGIGDGIAQRGEARRLRAAGDIAGADKLEREINRSEGRALLGLLPHGQALGNAVYGGKADGSVLNAAKRFGSAIVDQAKSDPVGLAMDVVPNVVGGAVLAKPTLSKMGSRVGTAVRGALPRPGVSLPRPAFPTLAELTNMGNWQYTPGMGAGGGGGVKFSPSQASERSVLPPVLDPYKTRLANQAMAAEALKRKTQSLAKAQVPDLLPMLDPKTGQPRRGSFFMTDQSAYNKPYQSIYGPANTTPTFNIGGGAGWADPDHMGGSGTSWAARGLSAFNTGHKLFDMYDKTGWLRAMGPESIDGSPDFLRASMLVEMPYALDAGIVTPLQARQALDVMAAMKPPGNIARDLNYLANNILDVSSAKEAIRQAFEMISTTPSKGADSFAFRKKVVAAMELAQKPGAKSSQNISQAAVDAFSGLPSVSKIRENLRDERFKDGTWNPFDIVGVLSGGKNPLGPDGKPLTVPAAKAPATTPYGYAYDAVPDRPTGVFPGGIPGNSETIKNQIVEWRKSQGRTVLPQDVTENDVKQFYRLQSYANAKTIQPSISDLIGAGVPIAGRSPRQTTLLDHAVNGRADKADPVAMHQAMAANDRATGLTQYASPQELAAVGDLHKLRDSETYWAITHPQKPWYGDIFPGLFGDNERELVSVFNNDPDMAGLTNGAVMLHAIENGATALDAFALPTAKYPGGVLPELYKRYGWQEVGRIPFDPSFYSPEKLAALEREWGVLDKDGRPTWVKQTDSTGRVTNYPDVAVMKWSGDDGLRASNRRSYIFGDSASMEQRRAGSALDDAEGRSAKFDSAAGQAGRPGLGNSGVDAAAQGSVGGGVVGGPGRASVGQPSNPLTSRDTRFVGGAQEVLGLPANVREALGLPAVGELVRTDPSNFGQGFDIGSSVGALGALDPKLFATTKEFLSRLQQDFNITHAGSSPLSINDGTGASMRPGTYERIGGAAGKQASDIFRDLQEQVDSGSRPDIALEKAKRRIDMLSTSLADKPGLVEEFQRHLTAIENDYYQGALKKKQKATKAGDEDAIARADLQLEAMKPTLGTTEKQIGSLITRLSDDKIGANEAGFWLRSQVDRATALGNILRLKYNIKSSAINLLQPLETLWPRVSTADYARITAESLKPSTRKRLEELGVVDGATKLEESAYVPLDRALANEISLDDDFMKLVSELEADWAVKEFDGVVIPEKEGAKRIPKTMAERLASASPFAAASAQNRIMGYLYGELDAKKKGITDPDQIHRNGLAWAEIVEFDNSTYNAPPILRSTQAKLLLQYKGFTLKSLENLADLATAPGTKAQKAARLAKWGAAKGTTGGVKVLAMWPAGAVGLAAYAYARDTFKARGMSEEEAQKAAEGVYFGLPALAGADISGSLGILEEPFGETPNDKLVSGLMGPTISSVSNLMTMKEQDRNPLDIAARFSPYVKQGVAISDMITGKNKDVMVSKNSANKKGSRPPTLSEMALRGLAVPLAAQSGAYADKDLLKDYQKEIARLDYELMMMNPRHAAKSRYDQDRMRLDSARSAERDFTDVARARTMVERLKAKLATKRSSSSPATTGG